MFRTIVVMLKVSLLVVLAMGVAGCSYNKLKRENAELKDQVSKLNEALSAAEGEKSQLAQDKAGVEGELERLRRQQQQLEDAKNRLRGEGFDVTVGEGVMVVTLPAKILYPSGSATLSTGGKDKLKALSKTLNDTLAGFPIEVQGHTDTDPIRLTKDKYASNWELSYDRAQTVAYYLIKSCSVDPKRVHASAYGEHKPVAPNTTSDGKAKNRRVEIVVMRPAGQ